MNGVRSLSSGPSEINKNCLPIDLPLFSQEMRLNEDPVVDSQLSEEK